MATTLPLRKDLTHYDFTIPLDGVTYLLEFRFNTRENTWYMDIRLEDETPISLSQKIVIDFPIAGRTKHPNKPKGAFVAVDTSGLQLAPRQDDFGTRVQLLYFTAEELKEIFE